MLENTEGANQIKDNQEKLGTTRRRQIKQHHFTQTNTNNVNKI